MSETGLKDALDRLLAAVHAFGEAVRAHERGTILEKLAEGENVKLPKLRTYAKQVGAVCAVKACGKPARAKGFCSAHYQKMRMLEQTGRLPSSWLNSPKPNSVENPTLLRGRAAVQALAAHKRKRKHS